MTREDYCSFELSKLLKEKGFDWDCHQYYFEDWEKRHSTITSMRPYNFNEDDKCISIPTHQMAMKWLREMHRKYIDIRYNNQNEEYRFIVFTMVKDKPIDFIHSEYHSTYEEAVEAALKYCLTKLI